MSHLLQLRLGQESQDELPKLVIVLQMQEVEDEYMLLGAEGHALDLVLSRSAPILGIEPHLTRAQNLQGHFLKLLACSVNKHHRCFINPIIRQPRVVTVLF